MNNGIYDMIMHQERDSKTASEVYDSKTKNKKIKNDPLGL